LTLQQSNISLRPFNSFGIEATAAHFSSVKSVAELQQLLATAPFQDKKAIIIGGGSNILIIKNPERPVIKIDIKGKEIIKEDEAGLQLRVGAGENWHELVLYCLENNWGGLENLSLIPGTVGAAPMQNIGAYGVEIKELVEEVEALMLADLTSKTFTNAHCKFGYRESIFKHDLKGQCIITHVVLRLTKTNHRYNTSYGAIKDLLEADFKGEINLRNISNAVIKIRESKLPDPAKTGNAGSFFKNPEIKEEQFKALKKQFPSMPGYLVLPGLMKVPAAWLIESCGWKGKRFGDAGVHDKQALVIVNHGNASGAEIIELAKKIQESVHEKFQINLNPEVNIID
jgi:UDP-N-acetylmuramate dehydrogenase